MNNDKFVFTKISSQEYEFIKSINNLIGDRRIDFGSYYVLFVENVFSDLYHCLIVAKRQNNRYMIKASDALKEFKQIISKLIERKI